MTSGLFVKLEYLGFRIYGFRVLGIPQPRNLNSPMKVPIFIPNSPLNTQKTLPVRFASIGLHKEGQRLGHTDGIGQPSVGEGFRVYLQPQLPTFFGFYFLLVKMESQVGSGGCFRKSVQGILFGSSVSGSNLYLLGLAGLFLGWFFGLCFGSWVAGWGA